MERFLVFCGGIWRLGSEGKDEKAGREVE